MSVARSEAQRRTTDGVAAPAAGLGAHRVAATCILPMRARADAVGGGATARRFARAAGWPESDAEAAALVVMELATNAVRHAGGGTCRLEVDTACIRVEVDDDGPGLPDWVLAGRTAGVSLEASRPAGTPRAAGLGAGLDGVGRLAHAVSFQNREPRGARATALVRPRHGAGEQALRGENADSWREGAGLAPRGRGQHPAHFKEDSMPLKWFETKTPGGTAVLRMESSGIVTAEDAERLMEAIGPASRYHLWPKIGFAAPGTSISPAARKILSDPKNRPPEPAPTAVVLTSAVMRVTVGFIVRLSSAGATRFFPNEAEANAWLDETTSK